jgi:hypothetical protein
MRPAARQLVVPVLVLLAAASATTPAPAAPTGDPSPQELWRAYPLEPGHAAPSVRLPASSAVSRTPVPATTHPAASGGSPGWLLVLAIGAATLLLGILAGHRARRPQLAATAPAPPATPEPAPPAPPPDPEPRRRAAAPAARPVAEDAEPPPALAPPPPPRPAAERKPLRAAPPPAPPPDIAVDRPPLLGPGPLPGWADPPAEPAALPLSRRFRRVAWPSWSRALWRCEITYHYGILTADFRAVAHEPGRRRRVEVGRGGVHRRPGWGVEVPDDELGAAVRVLSDALVAAGWEPVGRPDGQTLPRFVWPRAGTPALELPELEHVTREEDDDG